MHKRIGTADSRHRYFEFYGRAVINSLSCKIQPCRQPASVTDVTRWPGVRSSSDSVLLQGLTEKLGGGGGTAEPREEQGSGEGAPILFQDSDSHADAICLLSDQHPEGLQDLAPPPPPCTNLKNRGWCSKLFSSKTRLRSLCSCSIRCFCTSASSMFPSSRSLGIEGREQGTVAEKQQPTTSLPKAGPSSAHD